MQPNPIPCQETTIDGPRTRRWSLDAGQCPELAAHHIAWLGIDTVFAPYSRVRLAPSGSFFLATLEGEGRVWLEGRWERVTAGSIGLSEHRVGKRSVRTEGEWNGQGQWLDVGLRSVNT